MRVILICIAIGLMISSCKHLDRQSEIIKGDTSQYIKLSEEERDSVRLKDQLDKALLIANRNIESEDFYESFEVVFDSSSRILTKLTIKDHFANGKSLIVKRETPILNIIDVYFRKHNVFKKVITYEQGALTYLNDTIQDVNGDGRKDFLINWYPMSGCCLRNVIDVFLQLPNETFSEKLEFMNPTFFADEKIIRGVTYGHPGEAALYKYKWNGTQIDTIEYIYHGKIGNGHYIKSRYLPSDRRNDQKNNVGVFLAPDEYFGIYGFDWFTNTRTRE